MENPTSRKSPLSPTEIAQRIATTWEATAALQFTSGPPFAESYNERKARLAAKPE